MSDLKSNTISILSADSWQNIYKNRDKAKENDALDLLIFTGSDESIINSLIYTFKELETDHNEEIFESSASVIVDNLEIIDQGLVNNAIDSSCLVVKFFNGKLASENFPKIKAALKDLNRIKMQIISCDRLEEMSTFIKNWSSYYERNIVDSVFYPYIKNLHILKHLWDMQDAQLSSEECLEMLTAYKDIGVKKNYSEDFSYSKILNFYFNIYLKKSRVPF